MKAPIRRRAFVRATVASAGALVGATTGGWGTMAEAAEAATKPAVPLAESLSKPDLLEATLAIAESNMRACHHCAQATFLTLQEVFGLEGGPMVKALTPMPGVAERGETCGAVIGGLMALGLIFGLDRMDDWNGWRSCLVPCRDFCARFAQEHGSTQCGDLLEKYFGARLNLADPADAAKFMAAKPGPGEVCGRVVAQAARMAVEVVLEHGRRA